VRILWRSGDYKSGNEIVLRVDGRRCCGSIKKLVNDSLRTWETLRADTVLNLACSWCGLLRGGCGNGEKLSTHVVIYRTSSDASS
jgi:hypothetical protein